MKVKLLILAAIYFAFVNQSCNNDDDFYSSSYTGTYEGDLCGYSSEIVVSDQNDVIIINGFISAEKDGNTFETTTNGVTHHGELKDGYILYYQTLSGVTCGGKFEPK